MPHWVIYLQIALALYLLAAITYFPPPAFKGFGKFIERHFGDALGFYVLHLGIILVALGGLWPRASALIGTGNSLILAGIMALKLKTTPTPDTTTTTTTTTVEIPPAPGAAPPAIVRK